MHGLDRDPELVAGAGNDLSSHSVDYYPENANGGLAPEEGRDYSSAAVEKRLNKLIDELPKPEIAEIEVEVPEGQGAIKTFELLQEKLEKQYGDGPKPLLVQKLLGMSPEELAEKYGFYDPNSPAESAMMHLGDKFEISDEGLKYIHADGSGTLLEDGRDFATP